MTSAELDVTEQSWLSSSLLVLQASGLNRQEQAGATPAFHHIQSPLVPEPWKTVPGRWLSRRWVMLVLKYDSEDQENRLLCHSSVLSKPCLISLLCLHSGISRGNVTNIPLQNCGSALHLETFYSPSYISSTLQMVVQTVKCRVAPSW